MKGRGLGMSRRVIIVVLVVGWVTLIGTLVGHTMVLPDWATSLASKYPEVAHLEAPMLTVSVLCLVPLQVAAILTWPLARSLKNGAGESRVARYMGTIAIALTMSVALGVGTLI